MFGRPNSSAEDAKNKPGGAGQVRPDHAMNSYIADNLEVFFKRNINMS